MTSPPTTRSCRCSWTLTDGSEVKDVDSEVKSAARLEPAMMRAMKLLPATGRRTVLERKV